MTKNTNPVSAGTDPSGFVSSTLFPTTSIPSPAVVKPFKPMFQKLFNSKNQMAEMDDSNYFVRIVRLFLNNQMAEMDYSMIPYAVS